MVALFVVLTFLLFILIDLIVLKSQGKEHPAFATYKVFNRGSFIFPEDIFLAPGHTWLQNIKDGLVKIGVDEFIVKSLGKIKLNVLKNEGENVKKGEPIFQTNIGPKVLNFYAPIDGKVKYVNKNLSTKKVEDPYDIDWGLMIEPINFQESLQILKTKESAVDWLKKEFSRFKDFLMIHSKDPEFVGLTMADGGNIVEGVASHLNEKALSEFEKEFLSL